MPAGTIADLAVLGIVHAADTVTDRIPAVAKSLVPELWHPTTGVIDTAIRRHLDHAHFYETGAGTAAITGAGRHRLKDLLLFDPGDQTTPEILAREAVQFCFLDTVDPETAVQVLRRQHQRMRERLAAFRDRCRQCPHGGRYTSIWMGMERRRLETAAQVLGMICKENDATMDAPQQSEAAQ